MPEEGKEVGITAEAGKAVQSAFGAMASSPLSIALLLVNIAFLVFSTYIMRELSINSRERSKTQNELILSLVKDMRDCRQPVRQRRDPSLTPNDGMRDDREDSSMKRG